MSRATPWIVALLVSVLANGAMLGLTLHTVSDGPRFDHGDHRPPPGARGDGFNVRGFLGALPEEDREAAVERLRASREDVVERLRDVRRAQAGVEEALLREPFDPDAVRAALGELRQARGQMESEVEAAIVDILAVLPPEERLQALEQGMRGRPRHHRPQPHGMRGPPDRP